MKLPNRIPELEQYFVSGDKTIYYLQEITKYDEGHSESNIIGVWDSLNGDIDKAAQNIIKQRKEFCTINKFVKPHTMTMRKVKATISSEVVESQSEHYGINHKFKQLECTNCHGRINYGDDVVVKEYNTCNRYFCCNDCLAEYENSYKLLSDDENYDKLFIDDSDINKSKK
jgi:hypothetical protein